VQTALLVLAGILLTCISLSILWIYKCKGTGNLAKDLQQNDNICKDT
jgi:hypothetical protein